jgi:outer membrane protein insertion porin family
MIRVRHGVDWALRAAVVAICLVLLSPGIPIRGQSLWDPGRPPGPDSLSPPAARPTRLGAPEATPDREAIVADVRIVGNQFMSAAKVRSYLKTRPGRPFDAEVVQADVRRLVSRGLFRDVRTFTEQTPQGTVVTFEVFERPTIRHIEFIGNLGMNKKFLLKQSDLKIGDSLNYYAVEEARRKIEDTYTERGYQRVQVTVLEGMEPRDQGVVFRIHEGPKARVLGVRMVGNTIASDARLKTQIKSKAGFLYLFGGAVQQNKIDEDIERLTGYYRGLGYFHAKVGKELAFDSSGKWLTITFIINEGPRYRLRSVSFVGNERFEDQKLVELTGLGSGQFFNLAQMNADLRALRDLYGSEGYVYADIQADPRFLEEPGVLDLVYDITEGDQYRVGEITVEIQGDHPHTRQSVVLNRRGHLQPGDIVDVRAVRSWETRLQRSQLFAHEPHRGVSPHVKIVPPQFSEPVPATAARPREGTRRLPTARGQNPRSGGSLPAAGPNGQESRSWHR